MSRRGNYLGGSTVVRAGSNWLSSGRSMWETTPEKLAEELKTREIVDWHKAEERRLIRQRIAERKAAAEARAYNTPEAKAKRAAEAANARATIKKRMSRVTVVKKAPKRIEFE